VNTELSGLAGKHAVVTGGGSGIGAAAAAALVRAGARVTLMGRDAARLAAQRDALSVLDKSDSTSAAGELTCITVDVAREAAVIAAFEQAGPVDILINNAGQAQAAPFTQTDMALWQRMLDVNLTGVFLCTRAVLPGMLERGYGRIVNIASTAGQIGYAYVAAYCAAKHGVIGLTRSLALEVAAKGITVNAVCPGYTETELLRASLDQITSKTSRSEKEARSILLRNNPQQRFVAPDEVANAALWLCMPGSAAITGQSISVSGGEVT
jgi:NAD(P)-dependent dehydrogenase (short-subunit alcohol dehydrogenase family)